jgi:hypothetical protein
VRQWKEAEQWANGDMRRTRELNLIRGTVDRLLEVFMRETGSDARNEIPSRKQHEWLLPLVQRFSATPSGGELPLLASNPHGAAWVAQLKASYAYKRDLERCHEKGGGPGGSPSGFPWKMAMRELGNIKAKAISDGDALCLAYDVVERTYVGGYWR